jgi:hypothetical protein
MPHQLFSRKKFPRLEALEEITNPFFVATTLKDKDGIILSFLQERFDPRGFGSYTTRTSYHNPDAIFSKEIVVYDVLDPRKTTIYLNESFLEEYNPVLQ